MSAELEDGEDGWAPKLVLSPPAEAPGPELAKVVEMASDEDEGLSDLQKLMRIKVSEVQSA